MPNDNSCCGNCFYWVRLVPKRTENELSACHRYAPRPTSAGITSGGVPEEPRWLITASDSWCGDWKEKNNA